MIGGKHEILERYSKVEKDADALGRVIVVGKLRPSAELNVIRLADSQDNYVVFVSRVAASVRKIDDIVYAPPRTKSELEAVIDALDTEGLTAAISAFARLHAEGEPVGEDTSKNLP